MLQARSVNHRIAYMEAGSHIGIGQDARMIQSGSDVNLAIVLHGTIATDDDASVKSCVGADVARFMKSHGGMNISGRVDPDFLPGLEPCRLNTAPSCQRVLHEFPV